MVDDTNITMTSLIIICNCIRDPFEKRVILPEEAVKNLGTGLIIICNYIIDPFGKRVILPEEAVKNLGTGYMEAEYVTYEYEKYKGI